MELPVCSCGSGPRQLFLPVETKYFCHQLYEEEIFAVLILIDKSTRVFCICLLIGCFLSIY